MQGYRGGSSRTHVATVCDVACVPTHLVFGVKQHTMSLLCGLLMAIPTLRLQHTLKDHSRAHRGDVCALLPEALLTAGL